jgi:hypothetical protein
MMRGSLGLVGLLVVLATSCAPVVNLIAPQCPPGYECARTSNGWSIKADSSAPGFVVAASADITEFSSSPSATGGKTCQRVPVAAGPLRNIECTAPNTVRIVTSGQMQTLILANAPVVRSARQPSRSP